VKEDEPKKLVKNDLTVSIDRQRGAALYEDAKIRELFSCRSGKQMHYGGQARS
jgi:hypothetical protein